MTTNNDVIEIEVGARVGVIVSADKDTIRLLGFGTYQGELVPPAPFGVERAVLGVSTWEERDSLAKEMIAEMRKAEQAAGTAEADLPPEGFIPPRPTNPAVLLDTGETVWGHQVYWGPETFIREMLATRRVVEVPVAEFLAQCN